MQDKKTAEAIRQEMADVFYWLVRLSDILDVDIEATFWKKMQLNRKKYPIAKARGTAKKYTDL